MCEWSGDWRQLMLRYSDVTACAPHKNSGKQWNCLARRAGGRWNKEKQGHTERGNAWVAQLVARSRGHELRGNFSRENSTKTEVSLVSVSSKDSEYAARLICRSSRNIYHPPFALFTNFCLNFKTSFFKMCCVLFFISLCSSCVKRLFHKLSHVVKVLISVNLSGFTHTHTHKYSKHCKRENTKYSYYICSSFFPSFAWFSGIRNVD